MYQEIFQEIVSITQHDYSGCEDKKGWDNPDVYAKEIESLEVKNELTPTQFVKIVQDYLLDFKDHHMSFRHITNENQKQYDSGFKVRRYNDRLYITAVSNETRLEKGFSIVSLENKSIPELLEIHKRRLGENNQERENWDKIIREYSFCEVENLSGAKSMMELNQYESSKYIPQYSLKSLDKNIQLMTLTDFDNPDAINRLVESHKEKLDHCKDLIIDVRVNYGGSDSAYYPLLPYIFPEQVTNLNEDGEIMLTNCSDRNYELRVKSFRNSLKDIQDEGTIKVINILLREWEKNKGKGFVEFDFSELEEDELIEGRRSPERVIVLADVTCGSSGDSFVETCKMSNKVTVIGRATAGLNDYSNLAVMSWDGLFELWYPTSRLSRIDEGRGMTEVGVIPHVHIPWTPNHIFEDIDLNVAIDMLKNNSYR
ncbi:S41 family peptidase [Bacillus sp. FJAT-49736]|uniref:S41 family peptidase n=1 Tax=Bacillus sp. FJAT-49736 TaxID=2833582 RepID=UPI001BCA20E2|nr:S41 family peptidase [Bacillus sp. FJAT-49736]MBS4173526.1 peptidase [Bacillus sp. FJAT-49736]MBS4175916.1 peptidase [Bacillus sp. FJAT-49736]